MTDGAGLPLALSDLVAALRDRKLVDATVTCGHAFGGDYEAVSVFSSLVVARHVAEADVTIVAMGPGIVGTNTRLGFSGLEVGPDPRRRRARSAACRSRACESRSRILAPAISVSRTTARPRCGSRPATGCRSRCRASAGRRRLGCAPISSTSGIAARHDLVDVEPPDVLGLFADHDLDIVSMGRPAAADPVLFLAAAAAGTLAARHLPSSAELA